MPEIIDEMFLVTFVTQEGKLCLLLQKSELDNLEPKDYIKSTGYKKCKFVDGAWEGYNDKGNIATIKQGIGEVSVRIPQI